jgi:hypothetical protein
MAALEPPPPFATLYVLCKRSGRAPLFACGFDPLRSCFAQDAASARRFSSVAAALTYRAGLTDRDAQECGVFLLTADGRLVPPEEAEPTSLWGRNGGGARYPSSVGPLAAGRRNRG